MNKKGFSLIELIVAIGIFVIVIGIPYKLFIQELKTTVREVSLSQTSIEQVPSLEIIRKDIETAGYGLPWDTVGKTYTEASSSTHPPLYSSTITPASFNDISNKAPKAIIGRKDVTNYEFSYLVLKSTSFGLNEAANHWSYIDSSKKLNIWPNTSTANYNNFKTYTNGGKDRVIVMDAGNRVIKGGHLYFTILQNASLANGTNPAVYGLPSNLPKSVYLVYGVYTSNPVAPFNRIDYRLYDGTNNPSECAVGTHTLGRAIMQQGGGVMQSYPLLHCVADFQVGFGLDTNNDGNIDTWTQDTTTALTTAKDVRDQLKQVRVYILMQNGTKDKNYNYPNDNITVGETINGTTIGRNFNLSTKITDYKHYRWKVIKLVATPKNLE